MEEGWGWTPQLQSRSAPTLGWAGCTALAYIRTTSSGVLSWWGSWCGVSHFRSWELNGPKNRTTPQCSQGSHRAWGGLVVLWFPAVHNHLYCFRCIQLQVVVPTPVEQTVSFLSVGSQCALPMALLAPIWSPGWCRLSKQVCLNSWCTPL